MKLVPLSLCGAAVRLEPLQASHVDALAAVGLEPSLWERTTIQVQTRAEMEDYVRSALAAETAGTALPFVIVEIVTGKIIGSTRFHTYVPEHRRIEIGFTWIVPSRQRTGVNTEAKYLMLRHAFEQLRCIRVELRADAENEPSCRSLTRLGAKREGTLRNYRITERRGIRDLALFSIIAEEWPAIRTELESRLGRK